MHCIYSSDISLLIRAWCQHPVLSFSKAEWFHSINNPHRLTRLDLTGCWQIILRSSLLSCSFEVAGLKASLWFFSTWKQNKPWRKAPSFQSDQLIWSREHTVWGHTQVPGLCPLMGGGGLGLHPAHLNNLNCLNWWSWKLQHDTFWPVLGSNWVLSKESFVCNSVNGHYTWHASMITYDRLIGFSLDAAEPSAPLICWNLHIYV